jgi:hypothetical protein
MTDRELLVAAAKAAGIVTLALEHDGSLRDVSGLHPMSNVLNAPHWSPLRDDAQALRLAVRLNLMILPYPEDNATRVVRWRIADDPDNTIVSWGTPPDALDATRRAITRAAAQIGGGK